MPSAAHIAGYYGLPLDASPEFVRGYLDAMESRFDQRGQGVACGKGWIPRSKKCSSDKAKQTSKEAKAKTVEKSKARAELKRAVKGAKGQKARVKVIDPPQISREESLALLNPTKYGDYKSRERGYALRTSTLRQIEKDHPDLAPVINDARARDDYSPDTAEVGDVMIFRLPEGSRKFVGISPETAYMQITSVKNGRVRGIPMDEFGMPLTTKAQHIKADVTPPRGKDRKGWAWIKVNFPQDEWKGQSRYSSEAQKQRARQLTRSDAFLQGYLDIMRLDTVRPSCMECVEKHLGAALVLMGEAEAGYPEHKLLAIGHLHEAADESADRMPELSALLRDIRKRYQQGEPIEFEDILEALNQHGVWRFDRKGEGVACGRGWISRRKKCGRDKSRTTSPEAKARTVEKQKVRQQLRGQVKAAKGQKARTIGYQELGERRGQMTLPLGGGGNQPVSPKEATKGTTNPKPQIADDASIANMGITEFLEGRDPASPVGKALVKTHQKAVRRHQKSTVADYEAKSGRILTESDVQSGMEGLGVDPGQIAGRPVLVERARPKGRGKTYAVGSYDRDGKLQLDPTTAAGSATEAKYNYLNTMDLLPGRKNAYNRTDSFLRGYLEVMSWQFDRKGAAHG